MNQKHNNSLEEPVVQVGDKISIAWPTESGQLRQCHADVIAIHQSTKRKDDSIYVYQLLFEDGSKKKTRLLGTQFTIIDSSSEYFDPSKKRSLSSVDIDKPSKKILSEQSKTQYGYGWSRYVKFCAEKGLPLDGGGGSISDQMEAFLTYVVVEDPVKTVTPAVANSYISAIGKTLIETNQLASMSQIRTPKFTAHLDAYLKAFKLLKQQQQQQQLLGDLVDEKDHQIQLHIRPTDEDQSGEPPVEHSVIEV
mmetsp:Transcript_17014/g.17766  ORF Transcript_17014/g.17766 Transcript_17014/m.17766 type:complete len:251 (-) Transcript_17014:71-823(-)